MKRWCYINLVQRQGRGKGGGGGEADWHRITRDRQTDICMKCDKVFKIQEKFDDTNPMIIYVTRRTQAELTLYGESNVLLIKF